MRRASRWLRRVEITLFILGVSLLGGALGATVHRKNFEAEQNRVLEARMAHVTLPATTTDPGRPSATPLNAVESTTAPDSGSETDATRPAALPADSTPAATERGPARPVPAARAASAAPAGDLALLGRLEVPRIGLEAIVLAGDDNATLDRAVGWVGGTAAPGTGGNTALAGHRDTHFRPLENVKVNDRIRFVVPPYVYEYEVVSLRVVRPSEVSVLESTGTEELTLVTCYPFRWVGPAPDRFIVKAVRVDGSIPAANTQR